MRIIAFIKRAHHGATSVVFRQPLIKLKVEGIDDTYNIVHSRFNEPPIFITLLLFSKSRENLSIRSKLLL